MTTIKVFLLKLLLSADTSQNPILSEEVTVLRISCSVESIPNDGLQSSTEISRVMIS